MNILQIQQHKIGTNDMPFAVKVQFVNDLHDLKLPMNHSETRFYNKLYGGQ